MRVMGPGHFLFAAGIAGLGLLSLISGDFAYTWQPVPSGVPHRELLARASGILMMAGGMGMLVKRTAVPMALAMTIYLLSWVFLLQAPRAARAPGDVGAWLGVGESVVLMCGGWILFASLSAQEGRLRIPFVSGPGGIRLARFLFGASCLVLGLSHFVYTEGQAWFRHGCHTTWASLTSPERGISRRAPPFSWGFFHARRQRLKRS